MTISTHKSKTLPPAGTRPPAPPWVKIAVWLLLLVCLGLAAGRGPLLRWAATQPVVPLMQPVSVPKKPVKPAKAPSRAQTFERFKGMAAALIRLGLLPPGYVAVQGIGALGLSIIGLDLAIGALSLVIQTNIARRQPGLMLRVRVPLPQGARATTDTGADLLRALHRQLPASGATLGQAPWLALLLSARPDEPVELGIWIAGGTATQRGSWAAAVRKTIQGLVPDAVIDVQPDALATACLSGRCVAAQEWRLSLAPHFPLRLHDDHAGQASLLGPLLGALQPRQGVLYTEIQLVLQARPDDVNLSKGWRASATRRLLKLKARGEYALGDDAKALETKLAGPVYHATLRAVAIAEMGKASAARAELAEIGAVLGQYAARSSSRLQRWAAGASMSLHVPSQPKARRMPRLQRLLARAPRAVPPPTLLWTPAWRGPAILGPDELCSLWHLPTPALGRLVRWLPCRYLPPPPHAFAPNGATPPARLIIGYGRHRDGGEAPVGLPLRDARQGIAFTAPPGVGKTQLASNLADQLRPCGYTLIDGKGDDAGNLVETMRRRIPLEDEGRLVILDVLDAAWPVGLNPLAGVDLSTPGGADQTLGQIEAIFARLDPETWAKAPRMKNYLRKATLLVLAGEPHPTIAHVKQALLDERYRARLLPHCKNVEVLDFWTVEFPQIGEQQKSSRDALVSRFDMLLDSELTRYLFNQTTPALAFRDVIAERLIVLAPLAHRALGGLAAPVGMLLFQALMRAAFSRPGSDQTRAEYGFIGDEFQVLVENCDTKDVRDALTQVRAFGIVTIIANQLHAQLGDLAEYALTAISNRILLRTQEPDATLYARHYAESGIAAADISGQEPREHQYAWIGVEGKLTRLFSMRPLPWQPPLELVPATYAGRDWREALPRETPTPLFDAEVRRLMHGEIPDEQATAEALAAAPEEWWNWLVQRWDAIREHQRQQILAHPGCIPDTHERQVWLARLRAARRRVLAMAEYARIRQTIGAQAHGQNVSGAPLRQGSMQMSGTTMSTSDAPATQQPYFQELDQREPGRLARVEPSDLLFEEPATREEAR